MSFVTERVYICLNVNSFELVTGIFMVGPVEESSLVDPTPHPKNHEGIFTITYGIEEGPNVAKIS